MNSAIGHRKKIDNAGVAISYIEAGCGPLVIFCHGFPGLAYSWRHQLQALEHAGFKGVAVDMRGYGGSGKPADVAAYSLDHIRSDILTLLDVLGEERAIFVGHDFGAPVVWNLALECPERVAGLSVLSVPYDFDYYGRRGAGHLADPLPELPPSRQFAMHAEKAFLHAHYFQQPELADRALGDHAATFLRRLFWTLSGEGDLQAAFSQAKPGMGYVDVLPEPEMQLPWHWLDEPALDHYVETYKSTGFTGPLNWYRVADINWNLNLRYIGQKIEAPTLFLAGERDPVITMSGADAIEFMRKMVPRMQEPEFFPGAGHWVQQEAASAVNRHLLGFVHSIYASS